MTPCTPGQGVTLAFYRGRGTWRDLVTRAGTLWTYAGALRPRASHCELVAPATPLQDALCVSASKRDGERVRLRRIDLTSGNWRLYTLSGDGWAAWGRATKELDAGYDNAGALASAFPRLAREHPTRWFCSELCAYALGWPEPWRYHPAALEAAIMPGGPFKMAQA